MAREEVLEVCKTRAWAEVLLDQYAATVKAMEVADYMGVRLKECKGMWHIVLVDRREK
jgi:hypothetical protein